MRKLLIAGLIAAFGLLPLAAEAQQRPAPMPMPMPPSQAQPAGDAAGGLTAGQAAAIGVGAIAGAIVLDIFIGGGTGTLVGALGGGLIGNWVYAHHVRNYAQSMKGKPAALMREASVYADDAVAYVSDASTGIRARLAGWTEGAF